MQSSVFLVTLICLTAYGAIVPLDIFDWTKVRRPLILPEDNVPCYQTDTDFSQCIKDKFAIIMPQLNSFMNRDPVRAPYSEHEYKHGPMHGTVKFRNFNIYGLNKTEFLDADMSLLDDKVRAKIDLHIPHLRIEANYKNDFTYIWNETESVPDALKSLNGTEVDQDGLVGVTINDINVTHYWVGHVAAEGNLQLDDVELDVEVDGMEWNFSGLYPEKERNDLAVEVLNKNWRLFYNLYLPRFKYMVEPKIATMVNLFMGTTKFTSIIDTNKEDNSI